MGKSSWGLKPGSTVCEVAASGVLDVLASHELVVYLRLLAAVGAQRSRTVTIMNLELHRHRGGRTATVALKSLAEMGLIVVRYAAGQNGRTIEVLR